MVNRALPREQRDGGFLPDNRAAMQGANMSARMTISLAILLAGQGLVAGQGLLAGQAIAAAQSCGTALNEFREIVRTETSMGHVAQTNQAGASAEIARIEGLCRSGRNTEALAALQALQRRMGFR
jgi:hypothetical protein